MSLSSQRLEGVSGWGEVCRVVALLFQLLAIMLNKVQRSNWPDYLMEGNTPLSAVPSLDFGVWGNSSRHREECLDCSGGPRTRGET